MQNNTNTPTDLLQIKIENAKAKLPVETTNAIAAIDWRAAIMTIRGKKGYNFEQLGDLELETELLLCGLTTPEEYPKELQTRMRISKAETDELVNEMNNLVFRKIKEELIKNDERKKIFQARSVVEPEQSPVRSRPSEYGSATVTSGQPASNGMDKADTSILKSAGIDPIRADEGSQGPSASNGTEKPVESREEILKKVENPEAEKVKSILQQKIFTSIQTPLAKTEHTTENIASSTQNTTPKADPYRELPE